MNKETLFPEGGHQAYEEVEARSFWFRHRSAALLATFLGFPPPGRLLDVGGGTGFVARCLEDAGFDATVIEPDPAGAEIARKKGVEVVNSTFGDAAISDGSVAAIGAFDVVEHLADDTEIFQTFARALQPGGRLYLTVPAYSWLWSPIDDYTGHHRRYSARSLKEKVEAAGFAPLYDTYLFMWMVAPLLLLRSLPSRLGVRTYNTPDDLADDHVELRGPIGRIINYALSAELWWLKRGRRLPTGTSLLVVAEKRKPLTAPSPAPAPIARSVSSLALTKRATTRS